MLSDHCQEGELISTRLIFLQFNMKSTYHIIKVYQYMQQ